MATNYPIVRLTRPVSNEVVYLRSHKFSTLGVATGRHAPHDLQHCTIDIPANIATGYWQLEVVADGIASERLEVLISMHCHGHGFIGKVESLTYDRFGDFESFTLE